MKHQNALMTKLASFLALFLFTHSSATLRKQCPGNSMGEISLWITRRFRRDEDNEKDTMFASLVLVRFGHSFAA
jgi:hypothetical protein